MEFDMKKIPRKKLQYTMEEKRTVFITFLISPPCKAQCGNEFDVKILISYPSNIILRNANIDFIEIDLK